MRKLKPSYPWQYETSLRIAALQNRCAMQEIENCETEEKRRTSGEVSSGLVLFFSDL